MPETPRDTPPLASAALADAFKFPFPPPFCAGGFRQQAAEVPSGNASHCVCVAQLASVSVRPCPRGIEHFAIIACANALYLGLPTRIVYALDTRVVDGILTLSAIFVWEAVALLVDMLQIPIA